MLTSSHAFVAYLLCRKSEVKVWKYAVLGSVLPDVLMLFKYLYLFIITLSSGVLASDLIHEQIHQISFVQIYGLIFHSVFLWLFLAFLGIFYKRKFFYAFVIGGVSHVVTDFLTHRGQWAWNHLYPLDIAPIDGLVRFTDLAFMIPINILWLLIFVPKLWSYLKRSNF
ncbi:zinc dependent phospholipase C family protein [Candidatus Gracilibacteria bacterium]|nr:zinc dependent phospholipase C family protein [Candidatus Gracilibacteria bacterium]